MHCITWEMKVTSAFTWSFCGHQDVFVVCTENLTYFSTSFSFCSSTSKKTCISPSHFSTCCKNPFINHSAELSAQTLNSYTTIICCIYRYVNNLLFHSFKENIFTKWPSNEIFFTACNFKAAIVNSYREIK